VGQPPQTVLQFAEETGGHFLFVKSLFCHGAVFRRIGSKVRLGLPSLIL
jgi:hypothetical protein